MLQLLTPLMWPYIKFLQCNTLTSTAQNRCSRLTHQSHGAQATVSAGLHSITWLTFQVWTVIAGLDGHACKINTLCHGCLCHILQQHVISDISSQGHGKWCEQQVSQGAKPDKPMADNPASSSSISCRSGT